MGAAVVPGAFHPAVTDAAVEQASQGVGARGAPGLAIFGRSSLRRQQHPHSLERLDVHEWLVDNLLRPDPGALRVPLGLGDVALGNVVDVQELFLLVLLVPDLAAGVAGVEQNGPDRRLGPGDAAAMAVAGPVVGGRARNAFPGQSFGDQVEPWPWRNSQKIRPTMGAVSGSGFSLWSRFPSVALLGLGCGPTSLRR